MFKFIISIFLIISSDIVIPVDHMKKSFGMIHVGIKVTAINKDTVDLLALRLMSKIIDGPFMRASSFIVDHQKNKTVLLTSEHVCEELIKFKDPKQFKMIKDSIISAAVISNVFNSKDVKEKINIIPEIYIKDFFGNRYIFDKIVKKDHNTDLCKFTTIKEWGVKSLVNNVECKYGERIYNISASGGFYSKRSAPFREGNFSGIYLDSQENKKVKTNLYTIESLPGSSGSAVYNANGYVCGNINVSYSKSNLSLGATRADIINFLKI
jgi:hypothetical protein